MMYEDVDWIYLASDKFTFDSCKHCHNISPSIKGGTLSDYKVLKDRDLLY
jgi:hypothetical protein